MRTIVGLYDEYDQAKETYRDLVKAGFKRDNISLFANNREGEQDAKGGFFKDLFGGGSEADWRRTNLPGIGSVSSTGSLAEQMTDLNESLVTVLMEYGVPDPDAQMYAEGLRRGGNLIVLFSEEEDHQKAIQIMSEHNPVDIGQRMEIIKQKENWRGFDERANPLSHEQMANLRIPIIEEELRVGKRQVETGGLRIHTFVTQQQVQEDVNLRSERVNVERRPVDRPVNPQDIDAFKEDTIEFRETTEEPVVSKEAHVTEEIDINKNVEERTETVRDTVRRTNVDVENMRQTGKTRDLNALEPEFRKHYDTYFAKSNKDYAQIQAAYHFGAHEAQDSRYRNQDWNQVESKIRQDWEMSHPDMQWVDVRDAVYTGWERVR